MSGLLLPPVIGHRGAAAYAPENTLASFRQAAALGCRMVEFDVRLSADGVPVVFHDDHLERTSNGAGLVGKAQLADLKRLDCGAWLSAAFAGETIPTLAEALDLCLELGLAVNIEIKPDSGAERGTAIAALQVALPLWPAERPPPLISSFRRDALAAAMTTAPHWPRGLLVETLPSDWVVVANVLDCRSLHIAHTALTPNLVVAANTLGLAVLAYTVNDPAVANALWNTGVNAVFSDAPDRLGVSL